MMLNLSTGIPLFNAFLRLNHPWTAEMVGRMPFDAITFDMQHGMIEYADVLKMIGTFPSELYPMARLPQNDAGLSMKLLDAGVHGLICPQVKGATDVSSFVKHCYYPPTGERSFGPIRSGIVIDDYISRSKKIVTPFALIETKEAIQNLEAIASTPNLKGLYVGPYDLSLSMGLKGMADFNNPALMKLVRTIAKVAQRHSLLLAIQVYDLTKVPMLYDLGFQMFGVFDDQILFHQSLQRRFDKIADIKNKLT
jgi:4-hydroxy-2-oxoheptanedioate aldolase